MREPIKKESIAGFEAKTRLFGDHGKGKNQAIDMVTDPIRKVVWFELTDHKMKVYCGPYLDEAIEIYNNILEE